MPPKGWKKGVATLGPPPPGAVEAYNAGLLSGRWLKEDAPPLHHQPVPVTAEEMRDAGIAFIGAPAVTPLERPAHHTDVGVLFRKVAPNLYCAVQYRIENGVIIETKADHIHDTLDHTASTVATAIAKLINTGGVP